MRQNRSVAPTLRAGRGPVLVVPVLSAYVNKAIDRGRATEHPAAWPDDVAATRTFTRLGVELPRETRIHHGLKIAHWQVEPEVAIGTAGLEQEHPVASRCKAGYVLAK
jgi:hypothetical protein